VKATVTATTTTSGDRSSISNFWQKSGNNQPAATKTATATSGYKNCMAATKQQQQLVCKSGNKGNNRNSWQKPQN